VRGTRLYQTKTYATESYTKEAPASISQLEPSDLDKRNQILIQEDLGDRPSLEQTNEVLQSEFRPIEKDTIEGQRTTGIDSDVTSRISNEKFISDLAQFL
jgi:ribosome biogenesis SPOUT family RNA methylase Rps3